MPKELIETFKAVSENGKVFTINVYQNYVIEKTRYEGDIKLPGQIEWRTDNGFFVNKDDKDDNVFYIQGEIKVTRIR